MTRPIGEVMRKFIPGVFMLLVSVASFAKEPGEAFEKMLERCYAEPVEENLNALRQLHADLAMTVPLRDVWYAYLNQRMKPVPALRFEYPDEVLDLSEKRKYWLCIEIWGSWCPLCRSGLPEFNKVAAKMNADTKAGLRMYTLSYNSGDLQEFLQSHRYTFPVAEVDESVVRAFGAAGLPSRILISPENKYLIISSKAELAECLKGYLLKD